MRKLLIFLATIVFLLMFKSESSAQNLDCKLISIKYYNGFGCSEQFPILVKIRFKIKDINPEKLKIEISYPNNVVYTRNIENFDENGNIFYNFCSKIDQLNEFDVKLKSSNKESYPIHISAQATNLNIEN